MEQANILLRVFKSFVSSEEIENILDSHDYQEDARKWTGDFDGLEEDRKCFVIRLKKSMYTQKRKSLRRLESAQSRIIEDYTAKIGKGQKQSKHRFRVVCFYDDEGNTLRVATNLMSVSAEDIATLYKARWQIELFHRFLKQHLNMNHFFGTTPNAVYGQI